ncbi:MAG: carboxylating nicotinate-nucleotide diphosphorylase [Acidimicrobiia bacterium]|nr:carboxylating nicotinate-nucleotide diphosphorylase [Acidimicrobiia bacterium]
MSSHLEDVVRRALAEDLGSAGDITTMATVGEDKMARARLVSRAEGTLAGLETVKWVFALLDDEIECGLIVADGDRVGSGAVLAEISGPARGILTGERTALNLLGHLSGIATATADLVGRVEGTGARILDTRKTTPNLRALEKHAVRMGGGVNHRFGLFDAVLVKDNHIAASGGLTAALRGVRDRVGHTVRVEVEVDTLDQLDELLTLDADAVLLDNMDPDTLSRAIKLIDGRLITEASGNITADTVRQISETGVDYISSGWITHSAPALDVTLEIED